MHVATKVGLTNGGYIPYNDYSRDYSPPNSIRALKNHLVSSSSSGHSPLINSTTVTSSMNGGINNNNNLISNNNNINTYSLTRNRELRQDNGLPTIPLTMPNGIISKYYTLQSRKNSCCRHERIREKYLTQATLILDQSLLNNVDIRYSATYGNPYLKSSSISPLPPPTTATSATHKPYTANPSVTPAPPPYNRSNNSNSSFSSSTTISGGSGSLLGGGINLSLSYPNSNSSSSGSTIPATAVVTSTASTTHITSPSRQFILPANGDLKKGSLATHV